MNKILNYIKSINGIGWASLLALIVTVGHSAFVYQAVSQYNQIISPVLAVIFALAFDIAVLIFVLRGRKLLSLTFSILQIGMNLLYYYPRLESGFEWFSALFISVCLPIALASFSHEIAEDQKKKEQFEKQERNLNKAEELELVLQDFIKSYNKENTLMSCLLEDQNNKYIILTENLKLLCDGEEERERETELLKIELSTCLENIENLKTQIENLENKEPDIPLSSLPLPEEFKQVVSKITKDANNLKSDINNLKESLDSYKKQIELKEEEKEAKLIEYVSDELVTFKTEVNEIKTNLNNLNTQSSNIKIVINTIIKDIVDRKNNPQSQTNLSYHNLFRN